MTTLKEDLEKQVLLNSESVAEIVTNVSTEALEDYNWEYRHLEANRGRLEERDPPFLAYTSKSVYFIVTYGEGHSQSTNTYSVPRSLPVRQSIDLPADFLTTRFTKVQ